jgi:hypothetical protein
MAIVIFEIPEKFLILKMFRELRDCSLPNNRMVALYTLTLSTTLLFICTVCRTQQL